MALGDLTAAMEALKDSLAAALPGRVVTRSFRHLPERKESELLAGVVTVVALGEHDFATWRGREADLGTLDVPVIGQLKVDDNAEPSELEDAEFALAEEIKAWLAEGAMEPPLRQCITKEFRQSGQTEFPFGWVTFRLEVQT